MKFRKKPVVIEAIQYRNEGDLGDAIAFLGNSFESQQSLGSVTRLAIQTLEGVLYASEGDWLIRGIKGEHYACKPDIFEATYEPVSP